MIIELYFLITTATVLFVVYAFMRGAYNHSKFNTKFDLLLLLFLGLFLAPSIFSWINVPIMILNYTVLDYTLILWFTLSITLFFMAYAILYAFMLVFSARIDMPLRFGKFFFIFLLIVNGIILSNLVLSVSIFTTPIEDHTYHSTIVLNQNWNLCFMMVFLMSSSPFIYQYFRITSKIQSKIGKTKLILISIGTIIISLTTFIRYAFPITPISLIYFSFLELSVAIFACYIFYNPNFLESLLMLLNIESVYIANSQGHVLHVTTIMGDKNKKMHDSLVGGVLKGADGVVSEIMEARKAGLSRIILNDGTAIILEKSDNSPLYYIIFARMYTEFTHQKILELKKMLDAYEEKPFEVNSHIFEAVFLDEAIQKVFIDQEF